MASRGCRRRSRCRTGARRSARSWCSTERGAVAASFQLADSGGPIGKLKTCRHSSRPRNHLIGGTMYTEQLSQGLSISGAPIHPQTLNNGNLTTGGVDMSKFRRLMAVVDIGAVTNGGSITATLEESSSVGGTYTTLS